MINVAVYTRVSTDSGKQDTQRQVDELKEHSLKMGYVVVQVYEERISGVKKNGDRPVLMKMLEDSKSGLFEKVLVWEISRLGRSVVESLNTIELLNKHKVSLFIKNYNLETLNEDGEENPLSKFMIQILLSVANMERDLIRSRFQSGYRNYINNGGKVGRKVGEVESKEKFLEKHKEVVKLLKRGLSLRQISKLTDGTSTTTIMKVKRLVKPSIYKSDFPNPLIL
jgi:DNA invertase Pin-like site-specific DNA recombinase